MSMSQLSESMVTKICKRGMGEVCCSFLIAAPPDGYSCAKGTDIDLLIRERRSSASITAMGDNCSGPPDFTPTPNFKPIPDDPAPPKTRTDKAWHQFCNPAIPGRYPVFAEYTNKVPAEVFEAVFKHAYITGGIDALELHMSLEESLKLQSHYAKLLNAHDGGSRLRFDSVDEWMARLRKLGKLIKSKEEAA